MTALRWPNGDPVERDTPIELEHPAPATAVLSSVTHPLRIEGELADGQRYCFRCRFGYVGVGGGVSDAAAALDQLRHRVQLPAHLWVGSFSDTDHLEFLWRIAWDRWAHDREGLERVLAAVDGLEP